MNPKYDTGSIRTDTRGFIRGVALFAVFGFALVYLISYGMGVALYEANGGHDPVQDSVEVVSDTTNVVVKCDDGTRSTVELGYEPTDEQLDDLMNTICKGGR